MIFSIFASTHLKRWWGLNEVKTNKMTRVHRTKRSFLHKAKRDIAKKRRFEQWRQKQIGMYFFYISSTLKRLVFWLRLAIPEVCVLECLNAY